MSALVLSNVTRTFGTDTGQRTAVARLSLAIEAGQVLSLLGPNGAGKTTTVRMASTLLAPTSGAIHVAGIDAVARPRKARAHLGLMLGGERGFYLRASAIDNLHLFGLLQGVPSRRVARRAEEVLDRVRLLERRNDPVEDFSRGMRQRLHIARALMASPQVVLMDEPSIGLDPQAARDLRILVRELADSGVAVLLTTHYMAEAEDVSDLVYVVDDGRVVASGGVQDIAAASGIREVVTWQQGQGSVPVVAPRLTVGAARHVTVMERNGVVTVEVYLAETGVPDDVIRTIAPAGVTWLRRRPSLEEAYLTLVDGEVRREQ